MIVAELAAKLGLNVDQGGFSAGSAAISNLKKGLMGLGLALGGVGVAFAAAIKRTADQGDKIDELSQQVGVNAQELQRMAYGAQFSGVSIDELAQAMGFLAKKGVKDLRGGMLEIADQFQQLPDGGAKAQFAMEKFGRAGKALIPFLNQGREAIAKLGDEAEASGAIMSEDMIKNSAGFNDSVDALAGSFTGFRNAITGPFLQPLAAALTELKEWVNLNREMLSSGVIGFFKVLGFTLKAVWMVLKPIRFVLNWIVKDLQRFKAVAIFVAAALLYNLLPALLANSGAMTALTALTTAWGQAVVIAALRAAAVAFIAVAPWVILLGILGLFIEDIYVAMTGGRSIFGDWQKLLKIDPTDSPWMKGIKALIQGIVTLLEYTILLPTKLGMEAFLKYKEMTADPMKGLSAEAQARVRGQLAQGYNLGNGMASAQAVPGAAPYYVSKPGAGASFAPTFNINAPGGDPEAIQQATSQALTNFWEEQFNGVLRKTEGAVD